MRAPLALALLLVSASASAEQRWSADARTVYAFTLGARPTGGLMPTAEFSYWRLGESASVAVGGSVGVLVDQPRWLGVLGGVAASLRGRPWSVVELSATAHIDGGRIPICNAWGLCLQYSGFYPAIAGSALYVPSERVSVGTYIGIRYVKTLGYTGPWFEPAIVGRINW